MGGSVKPSWTPATLRLGEIEPWTDNPRLSSRAQAQRLIDSERKFGKPAPFLVGPKRGGKYPPC